MEDTSDHGHGDYSRAGTIFYDRFRCLWFHTLEKQVHGLARV